MSFRHFPLQYEMRDGARGLVKACLRLWLILYNVPFSMGVSHRLASTRWYCVTKGSSFFAAVWFFCAEKDLFQKMGAMYTVHVALCEYFPSLFGYNHSHPLAVPLVWR